MKILLTILMAMLCIVAKGQKYTPPIDSITNRITYQSVIYIQGSKDQLYNKGLNWMAITFKSSNDVIQIKDKDNGKIVGMMVIQPDDARIGLVYLTITLLFKDGRYKYIITNFDYQGTSEFKAWGLEQDPGAWKSNMAKGMQHKIKSVCFSRAIDMIERLNNYMKSQDVSANF